MSDTTNSRIPQSDFEARYPYNQATITRSGHEMHINDTPGSESLRVSHTIGSYVEISKTGGWFQTVVGKVYQYFKSTFTLTVESHADAKIGGTYSLNVDGGSIESIAQNKTTAVGGDLIDGVGGIRQIHTEADRLESVNGSSVIYIKSDNHTSVDGDSVTAIAGNRVDMISGDWSVSGKNIEMSNDGDFRIACKDFKIDASGSMIINAPGGVTINTPSGSIQLTASGGVFVNGVPVP